MIRLLLLTAALLGGCSTYVPVQIELEKPKKPRECRVAGWERVSAMKTFAPGVTAVAINAAWARREVARNGVDRRNRDRARVCETFVDRVTSGEETMP